MRKMRRSITVMVSSTFIVAAMAAAGEGPCPAWNTDPGVPGITSSYVAALEWHDDGSGAKLYATGQFNGAAGVPQTQDLARWNGETWESVGGGLIGQFSNTLAVWQGRLYVGGTFDSAAGVPGTAKLACWDGTAWSGLDANLAGGGAIWGLEVFNDELWVCGKFTDIGGTTADNIARWDGEAWHDVEGSITGSLTVIFDMEVYDDGSGPALYAGGRFATIGGVTARNIAQWDGETWVPLGLGIGSGAAGSGAHVLEVIDDGNGPKLWVGGQSISQAGGVAANGLATWDGTAWAAVGEGLGSTVWDIEWFDDGVAPAVYAVGFFFDVHGSPDRLARWNGTSWEGIGTGLNDTAFGSMVYEDGGIPKLAIGGGFTLVDGQAANRVVLREGCATATETICPDDAGDYVRWFGGPVTGDALNLCASDDVRLEVLQSATVSPLLPFIRLEYWAHATIAAETVSRLDFDIECHVSANVSGGQNPDTLRTSIRNYDAGSWELIDQRGTGASTDEVITHTQTANAPDYVDAGDGEVRVRQDVFDPGNVFTPNWFLKVDLYEVTVTQ